MNNIHWVNEGRSAVGAKPDYLELSQIQQDGSGYRLELQEVSLGQIRLKWGTYNAPFEKVLSFHPEETTVVSHFRMKDPVPVAGKRQKSIGEGQFVVYQERSEAYDLCIAPTQEQCCHFFEVSMSEPMFDHFFTGESDFLMRFHKDAARQLPSYDFTASILPGMYGIIHDMHHTSFQGHLKGLYLEAKTIELFLLQIGQLDRQGSATLMKLKKQDIESLHEIKAYLETNFDQPASIAALARKAGINSMKLKSGFRELFHTTVFGHLHAVRMQEARRLLEEGLYVHEVADRVGYKHPHHFAAAFKKQFHVTPGSLRR